ncbi:hypothetical protein ABPG72_008774 [Tetrahymena utriculariae]
MCGGTGAEVITSIIGWAYFSAWSISFYGQVYENYKQQRAEGCKIDYLVFNFSGFFFYTIYNVIGYWGDSEANGTGDVEIQDVVFAIHALTLTCVALGQCFYYPRGKNQVTPFCYAATTAMWVFALAYASLDKTVFNKDGTWPAKLSLASWLGYMKLAITVFKYTIQVVWNIKRQSTEGWNIFNILCDITGGTLSVLQSVIKAIACGDNPFGGALNAVKYLLGLISIFFDVIFILQHYVIYRGKKPKTVQQEDDLNMQETPFKATYEESLN